MKRKVKLILGIHSLYNKDEFYNHFTKNFRSPDPSGSRFYLKKVFQDTADVYYGFCFSTIGGFLLGGTTPYRKFSSYRFGFLIREAVL